jgi:hypothetical protein
MIRPRKNPEPRKETIRKWVAGGDYVIGIDIEVEYPVDAPYEPCLRPEAVRYLERLADSARRGDLVALQQAGTVYERIKETAAHSPIDARDDQNTGSLAAPT